MKNQRKEKRRDLSRQVRDMYIDHGVELVTQKQRILIWNIILAGVLFCAVTLVVYFVMAYERKSFIEIKDIVQILAACISISTFLITIVQISNYLHQAKIQVAIKRKSDSIEVAKEYANTIIFEMSFVDRVIQSTLSNEEFSNLILNVPYSFNNEHYRRTELPDKVKKMFENDGDEIQINDIEKHAFISKVWKDRFGDFDNLKTTQSKDNGINLKLEYNRRFRGVILHVLNQLEWFAMEINQDVAENELLYNPLAGTYMHFIGEVYPIFYSRNEEITDHLYHSVIVLYRNWSQMKNRVAVAVNQTYCVETNPRQ